MLRDGARIMYYSFSLSGTEIHIFLLFFLRRIAKFIIRQTCNFMFNYAINTTVVILFSVRNIL